MVEQTTVVPEETIDFAPLDKILDEYASIKGAIIPVLQQTQEVYGYLPSEALTYIAERMRVPVSQVYGVATFYAQFYLERRGRHIVKICDGTACHVKGAGEIVRVLEEDLKIKAGETTPDYRVTLEVVYCLGSCGLAPVAVVDDEVVGRLVPDKARKIVSELD